MSSPRFVELVPHSLGPVGKAPSTSLRVSLLWVTEAISASDIDLRMS